MNVLLALRQKEGAAAQRDELVAERADLVKRLIQVGLEIALLDLHLAIVEAAPSTSSRTEAGESPATERPEQGHSGPVADSLPGRPRGERPPTALKGSGTSKGESGGER